MEWIMYSMSLFLGALVGITELVSRYKDAPILALSNWPAMLYVFLNSLLSLTAYFFVQEFNLTAVSSGAELVSESSNGSAVLEVLLSGLGAMAFFRSAVFTVRVNDVDVGIGPAGLAQIILDAADRAIDRNRAKPRADAVSEIMAQVDFSKASSALPTYCFALMQNVSTEEQQTVARQVDALKNAKMDVRVKSLSLGLLLMNLAGEDLLRAAVETLSETIQYSMTDSLLENIVLKPSVEHA